jgi:hypothetical protein
MTKNFCDLCGNPAMSFMPEMRVDFPDKIWSGSKSSPSLLSVVDGTWIPFITARVMFDQHDSPNGICHFRPDLCSGCMAKLLEKMASDLIGPPPGIVQ